MKITVEPTYKVVMLHFGDGSSVPARIWEGRTDLGTPVHCYITRICPSIEEPVPQAVLDEFAASLQETAKPSAAIRAIPLRMIL